MLRTLDTRVHSVADINQVTDLPVLGSIPFTKGSPRDLADVDGARRVEAFRALRTNLAYWNVDDAPKVFSVTSSIPGEGKTSTSISLAESLAEGGKRVLLIDADLRRPSVHKYLGLEGAAGLTTVLVGQAELADVVQPLAEYEMDVLVAGVVPPNPSELLGSLAMRNLIQQVAPQYAFVVVDCPPLLPVVDGAIVAGLADGTLFVVGSTVVKRTEVRTALDNLGRVGVDHVAVVQTRRVAESGRDSYSYRYAEKKSSARPLPALQV